MYLLEHERDELGEKRIERYHGGENQTLERELALAKKERDFAREQNLKTTESLKQLRDQYDRKIAALQTARAKEVLALQTFNETLQNESRAIQESLKQEIQAISSKYNLAMIELQSFQNELTTQRTLNTTLAKQLSENQQKMTELRSLYEQKVSELRISMENERKALETRNQTQIEESRAIQESLRAEISAIQGQYNVASTQITALRQQINTIETENSGLLKQNDILRDTMNVSWGSTIYVLLDATSWLQDGALETVTMLDDGRLELSPFVFEDLRQTWTLSSDGHIRCMHAVGKYIVPTEDCTSILSSSDPITPWVFRNTGDHRLRYTIESTSCKKQLGMGIGNILGLRPTTSLGPVPTWFIVPVGQFGSVL